jgi:hypothetical protein
MIGCAIGLRKRGSSRSPYALKLAVELPGRIAKTINEQEKATGPDGVMQYWGVGQAFDQSVTIYRLRCLEDIGEGWVKSLEANNAEAKESRIRAILADAGVLKPKVFVFRSQF